VRERTTAPGTSPIFARHFVPAREVIRAAWRWLRNRRNWVGRFPLDRLRAVSDPEGMDIDPSGAPQVGRGVVALIGALAFKSMSKDPPRPSVEVLETLTHVLR
jgi:hypothetical protein